MPTYAFPPVSVVAKRTGKCPVCDKRVTRSRTFTHTVSPFNRNEDGSVRSSDEVRECVKAEADAWVPDFTHTACEVSDGQ